METSCIITEGIPLQKPFSQPLLRNNPLNPSPIGLWSPRELRPCIPAPQLGRHRALVGTQYGGLA